MNVKFIEPIVKNEVGMDKKIYDHYMERKLNPEPKPKYLGPIIDGVDVGLVRYVIDHPSWPLTDITTTKIDEEDIDYGGYRVRYYHPETVTKPGIAVFFIHGGGWSNNTIHTYDSPCRRLAELLNAVVFSISYSLSPEAKFPTALEQCYNMLERMLAEPEKRFIDPNKVVVMGDSAGGNLAAALTIRDKDSKFIKMQVLYYPALDLTEEHKNSFDWKYYGDNIPELCKDKINQLFGKSGDTADFYCKKGEDRYNPLISPYFQDDYSVFPRTVIVVAEYDFLTRQCEDYAKKLDENGIKVDFIKYLGTFHGYLERTGFFDQGDMSLKLVSELIKEEFK